MECESGRLFRFSRDREIILYLLKVHADTHKRAVCILYVHGSQFPFCSGFSCDIGINYNKDANFKFLSSVFSGFIIQM